MHVVGFMMWCGGEREERRTMHGKRQKREEDHAEAFGWSDNVRTPIRPPMFVFRIHVPFNGKGGPNTMIQIYIKDLRVRFGDALVCGRLG